VGGGGIRRCARVRYTWLIGAVGWWVGEVWCSSSWLGVVGWMGVGRGDLSDTLDGWLGGIVVWGGCCMGDYCLGDCCLGDCCMGGLLYGGMCWGGLLYGGLCWVVEWAIVDTGLGYGARCDRVVDCDVCGR
jgi:hypothetical protein